VELRDRQATWNGFGNALSQAAELVAAPVLFGLFGWFLDSRLGTGHVFAVTLFLLGVAGVAARSYYAYKAAIEREEEGKPWTRSQR
jgi:F0F1-type ATP synthase assembly protein I